MNCSFCDWTIHHLWVEKLIAVSLFVASGFIHGRFEHTDKFGLSAILLFLGWGFLASAYLVQFDFSAVPFIIVMIMAMALPWCAGFDEGRFRKFGVAVFKLIIGLWATFFLFRIVELGKFG